MDRSEMQEEVRAHTQLAFSVRDILAQKFAELNALFAERHPEREPNPDSQTGIFFYEPFPLVETDIIGADCAEVFFISEGLHWPMEVRMNLYRDGEEYVHPDDLTDPEVLEEPCNQYRLEITAEGPVFVVNELIAQHHEKYEDPSLLASLSEAGAPYHKLNAETMKRLGVALTVALEASPADYPEFEENALHPE